MRRSRQLMTVAATLFGWAMPCVAVAGPPPAEAYEITYYLADDNGNRDRQMTEQDMTGFVNRARCECGQQLRARISLPNSSGFDNVQTEAYLGHDCAQAQFGINPSFFPCAQLATGFPQTFKNGPEYLFDPIYLAWGVVRGGPQSLGSAENAGVCAGISGNAGVWMCATNESCNNGDFFISGTQNVNIPEGSDPQGISYDLEPPFATPSNVRGLGGDGAIELRWDIGATGDINGYRVLCADADGNPLSTLR